MKYLYDLNDKIYNAIYEAYPFVKTGICCGPGWLGLILYALEYIKEYNEKENGNINVVSLKQKYGYLDISCDVATEDIFDMLDKIEDESEKICEVCGMSGKTHKIYGWYSTLCDFHAEQEAKRKTEMFERCSSKN